MHETKTASVRLSWWPTPQDYNEAIQIPLAHLQDAELKNGLVYTDANGLPRPVTGSFACVYRMRCESKDFALRLFLKSIGDQEHRYAIISKFIQNDELPYTVTFDFVKSGIQVRGEWLPALKMEWVDGVQFDDYLVQNIHSAKKIGELADKFVFMLDEMRRDGIAHGDLQHGNIIVCAGELKLVDYDGMFVPGMERFEANELGHRNYQHPGRGAKHFGAYLDNFSAWIIYASLRALEIDPHLIHQLGFGDDCLLFKQSDFVEPLQSPAFIAFERHSHPQLKSLGRFIRALLKIDPAAVPHLQTAVPAVAIDLEPLAENVSPLRTGPIIERDARPQWLQEDNKKDSGQTVRPLLASPAVTASWTVPTKITAKQWVKPSEEVYIPPELQAPTPREVAYHRGSGRRRPEFYQALMLLNPCFWALVCCIISGVQDGALQTQGESYPATVVDTSSVTFGGPDEQRVRCEYTVNGQTYYAEGVVLKSSEFILGGRTTVRALPWNPEVHDPIGPKTGSPQFMDYFYAALAGMACFIFELLIWLPAIRHRDLATFGAVSSATVDRLDAIGFMHHAELSYDFNGTSYSTKIQLPEREWSALFPKSREVILCNPLHPSQVVLYRFCAYHPSTNSGAVPSRSTPKSTP